MYDSGSMSERPRMGCEVLVDEDSISIQAPTRALGYAFVPNGAGLPYAVQGTRGGAVQEPRRPRQSGTSGQRSDVQTEI